jgi:hypothetical protein
MAPLKKRMELPEDRGARAAEVDLRQHAQERAEREARSQPTATQQIAALDERRAAGNGFIVAPPERLDAGAFRSWLHAVAEIGHPDDVVIAWHHCQNAHIKGQLLNEYDALRDAAGRRFHALVAEAERKRQIESAAAAKRAERAAIERRIAALRDEIAGLERKLALI